MRRSACSSRGSGRGFPSPGSVSSLEAARRAAARLLVLPALGLALLGSGCMKVGAYERGATIPYAEVESRKDDLAALVEDKLARREYERAFYALELARTRRFAADMIAKRDEPRAPAPWVRRLGDRFYEGEVEAAKAEGRPPPTKEAFLAQGFGPPDATEGQLASSRGSPLREQSRAVKDGAARAKSVDAEDDERFWEELKLIEAQLAAHQQKARTEGMTYAKLFEDRIVVVSTLDAQLTLAPGEALVEYYLGPTRADALVVTSEGAQHVSLPLPGPAIAEGVAALRKLITDDFVELLEGKRKDGTIRDAWIPTAQGLYQLIVAPVEAALAKSGQKIETLLIVAPGALANCPFAALASSDGRLLVERYRIAYEPSFSVYKAILSRPLTTEAPKLLSIGNTSLALAPKEARVMGAIFEGSETRIGPKQANETRFYETVKQFNILHFATHGQLVQSAPKLSHLYLGPTAEEDGLLTGIEIMTRLDLSHLYVAVLSACQTALTASEWKPDAGVATAVTEREKAALARSRAGTVDAELASITSAFLLAGAPSVVGSLWSVSDESTTKLMVRFYEGFLEVGPAEALRKAQLELMKDENPLFRHPYFWAAFGVYGLDK